MADQSLSNLSLRKDAIKSAVLELKEFPSLLERSFIPTGIADTCCEKSEFRVMQWNMLADALSESSPRHNFIKCPAQALTWSNRKYRSLQELLTYNPDIICLQEVDHFPDFYQPQLQQVGYEGAFVPKVDSPCLNSPNNSGPDGCAVFIDKERFLLKDSKRVQLEDSDGEKTNQVALILELLDKTKQQLIYCAVVHLKAKPEFEKRRHAQCQFVLKKVKELMKEESCSVIICGDFNAEPNEPMYTTMEKGINGILLHSAYKSATSAEPLFTTFKIRPKGEVMHTIDYVWHSSNLKVTGYLQVPQQDEIGCDGLPCMAYPSDHLSLIFDFCSI